MNINEQEVSFRNINEWGWEFFVCVCVRIRHERVMYCMYINNVDPFHCILFKKIKDSLWRIRQIENKLSCPDFWAAFY